MSKLNNDPFQEEHEQYLKKISESEVPMWILDQSQDLKMYSEIKPHEEIKGVIVNSDFSND